MSANTFDQSKLPSRHVTVGPQRAPHRSYYYAMGLSQEEIDQPFVGVATCWNEAAPCNIALNRQAQAVKLGVKAASGTPREFTTITVTDGIAMGHEGMRSSLASREAIADTVELTMRGHCYDALVGLAGCDKSLPGMMMAMVRLNVPSVFIYGGSILPGKAPAIDEIPEDFRTRDLTVQDMFEAVGRHQNGALSDKALDVLERVACPSAGACGGQFTANTMACVSEAIGLALMNSSGAPAPYESRDQYSEASGEAVMHLIEKNIRARDVVTLKSLENAARVVACTGGSTNAGLHLPAIANEAGIDFYLDDVCEIFRDTPYFVDLKPGGQYVAKDLFDAGGIPVVMKELRKAGLIHEDCVTASGYSIGEDLDKIDREADGKVIYPIEAPLTKTGGVVGLKGNLAPEGAIVKVAGIPSQNQVFTGPARVFECEEDAFAAVQKREYEEGEVIVIRNEGPAGGPGMREMLATTAALSKLAEIDPTTLPAVDNPGRIGSPVARVPNFFCVGLNYAKHAAESGMDLPTEPILFSKASSALSGPNDPIILPRGSVKSDWEVELGIVIGAPAHYVSEADALSHVAGYCTINDVSEREYQIERGGQWIKGKSAPTYGPVGPYLVTPDEVGDPQNLDLSLSLNGEVVQNSNTSDMIFGVAEIISYMSRFMLLQPGDVIATGTPSGVGMGMSPQRFLRAGDVVELEVIGLGRQRQEVHAS